ncbi:bifunctional 4-hydroxy-2-oxoglutarate aldolase/2-dehydro-3-deoxy-phosphogluconate aldolase [Sediminibacterium sp.]|uniref:bifunctional 4-hydroxy-2-oxoglutarate aldolase/2-dehydro-3-deoxy-phosphogluconate aldolase n=1 Tax=Sediminibacterium sp. TaxID=1917865 RepID=UPI0025F7916E|nr:bifunctional 4-hydroxy-2-oxoglutarate aldolase/2-dehydro-3-deoxy-phosphogluconate aldolase [Sediminibacterium sp.]MBW0177490.1 bifunctional 4-hydroxy-2-oxoglutarate aldolase/2-dehydro-3-deoxy-phosphogluconate aldolase [Sediminibacterium sp.]
MDNQAIIQSITTQGMLPLYYHEEATVTLEVAKALYAAGIRVIEYTNRGENALANFKHLLAQRDTVMPGMLLGIGTIKTVAHAQAFLDAGADFIICPGMIPEVAHYVHGRGKLWVPGCMTSTEIMMAEQLGAKFVKLFPGNLLGPGFVSAIKELFPAIAFMPTGGVELEEANIQAWFSAGVKAVGMGSKLITKNLLEQKDYTTICEQTKTVLNIIQRIKR